MSHEGEVLGMFGVQGPVLNENRLWECHIGAINRVLRPIILQLQ